MADADDADADAEAGGLWSVAAGSADEVRTCLLIASAWGYVKPAALDEPLELLDRELACSGNSL